MDRLISVNEEDPCHCDGREAARNYTAGVP